MQAFHTNKNQTIYTKDARFEDVFFFEKVEYNDVEKSGITSMQSYFEIKVEHQICCSLHLSMSLRNAFGDDVLANTNFSEWMQTYLLSL